MQISPKIAQNGAILALFSPFLALFRDFFSFFTYFYKFLHIYTNLCKNAQIDAKLWKYVYISAEMPIDMRYFAYRCTFLHISVNFF